MADAKTKVETPVTPEMIAAGWACLRRAHLPRLGPGDGLVEAYRAMLAAAPQPAASDVPQTDGGFLTATERRMIDQLNEAGKDRIQKARDEAYQNGWGDGYAEGLGKAASDVPHDVVRALEEARRAVEFFDEVRSASPEERSAVGTDHWDWVEKAVRRCALAAPAPSTSTDALDDDAKEAALNIGWRWFGVGHHDAAAVASEIEQLIADDRAKRAPSTSTEEALRAENARLIEAAQALLDAETVTVHVGYDEAAGGGNFVWADAIRTDDEAFTKLRTALSR